MKKAASLLAALVAFYMLAPTCAATSRPKVLDSVKGLGWIDIDEDTGQASLENHCTAFAINAEKHYWMTAAHCIELRDGHEIQGAYIDGHPAEAIAAESYWGVAIMVTPDYAAPALALRKDPIGWGEEITLVGYPLGMPFPSITYGRVANPDAPLGAPDGGSYRYMMLNVVGAPGNSGSPILDSHGRLISVLQVGWTVFAGMHGGTTQEELFSFSSYFSKIN